MNFKESDWASWFPGTQLFIHICLGLRCLAFSFWCHWPKCLLLSKASPSLCDPILFFSPPQGLCSWKLALSSGVHLPLPSCSSYVQRRFSISLSLRGEENKGTLSWSPSALSFLCSHSEENFLSSLPQLPFAFELCVSLSPPHSAVTVYLGHQNLCVTKVSNFGHFAFLLALKCYYGTGMTLLEALWRQLSHHHNLVYLSDCSMCVSLAGGCFAPKHQLS